MKTIQVTKAEFRQFQRRCLKQARESVVVLVGDSHVVMDREYYDEIRLRIDSAVKGLKGTGLLFPDQNEDPS